jgi:hypothetical protein
VSESSQSAPPSHAHTDEAGDGEDERQPSALPAVLAGSARVMPAAPTASGLSDERRQVLPTVQAAAVAAGGFVAGAAVVGLVHRRQRRAGALVKRRRGVIRRRARPPGAHTKGRAAGRTAELVQIVGSRSLLVDVHLLGGPGDR